MSLALKTNFMETILIITTTFLAIFSIAIFYLFWLSNEREGQVSLQLKSVQESRANLEKGYKETLDELDAVKLANEELRTDLKLLKSHYSDLKNNHKKQEQDMVQLMKERMDALEIIETYKSNVQNYEDAVINYKAALKMKERFLKDRNTKLKNSWKLNENLEKGIELLKSEIQSNQATISSLHLDFKGAVETIKLLNDTIEGL